MTTITKEDLIRYFKGETSRNQRNQIREAIRTNSELEETYFILVSMQESKVQSPATPPDKIIREVLKYGNSKQRERAN